jgi:serine/threonine protein kinase
MNTTTRPVLKNGQYILKNRLRKDIFSVTYRATDSQSGQTVAIKTPHDSLRQQQNFAQLKQQFLLAAEKFTVVEHPHLVRVLDCFEEEERPYLVMEYLPGQTLEELVPSSQPLPLPLAIHYIRQIGLALSALHQHGLLHQDIRPQNVIQPLGKNFLVLTDFDLTSNLTHRLGSTQASLSSAGYAPPEKYHPAAQLTSAADIYSLSATFYFLLTGQPPVPAPVRERYLPNYLAANAGRIGDRLLIPTLKQSQPRLTSAIELAVVRGLQISPQQRPQTVKSWLAILPRTLPPTPIERSERRVIAGFDFGKRFSGKRHQQLLEALNYPTIAADDTTNGSVIPIERGLRAKEESIVVCDPEPARDLVALTPELKLAEIPPPLTGDLAIPSPPFKVADSPLELEESESPSNAIAPVNSKIRRSLTLKTQSGNILRVLTQEPAAAPSQNLEAFAGEALLHSTPSVTPNSNEPAARDTLTPLLSSPSLATSTELPPEESASEDLEIEPSTAMTEANILPLGTSNPKESSAPQAEIPRATENFPPPFVGSGIDPKTSQTESGSSQKNWLWRSLLLTWAIATAAGIGFGLALRFNRPTVAGSTILHTEQSFPARALWPVREVEEREDKRQ